MKTSMDIRGWDDYVYTCNALVLDSHIALIYISSCFHLNYLSI